MLRLLYKIQIRLRNWLTKHSLNIILEIDHHNHSYKMKIRIKNNSVRLRLSKPDLDQFGKEGYIEEKTEFPGSTFTYAIQKLFDGKALDASFIDQKLTLFVPKHIVQEWTDTAIVGFNHALPVGENRTLFLLIEKDFKCIDGDTATDDQSEYFDNPVKTC